MAERWFVVVEFNQASGRPDSSQSIELFDNLGDADDFASELKATNRQEGRHETFQVFELMEVDRADG